MSKITINRGSFKLDEIEVKHGTLRIGRAADNDICIDDPSVSNHHAKIVTLFDVSYIEDLQSTNGTVLNGRTIQRQTLKSSDMVSLGRHYLLFHNDKEEEEDNDSDKTLVIGSEEKAIIARRAAERAQELANPPYQNQGNVSKPIEEILSKEEAEMILAEAQSSAPIAAKVAKEVLAEETTASVPSPPNVAPIKAAEKQHRTPQAEPVFEEEFYPNDFETELEETQISQGEITLEQRTPVSTEGAQAKLANGGGNSVVKKPTPARPVATQTHSSRAQPNHNTPKVAPSNAGRTPTPGAAPRPLNQAARQTAKKEDSLVHTQELDPTPSKIAMQKTKRNLAPNAQGQNSQVQNAQARANANTLNKPAPGAAAKKPPLKVISDFDSPDIESTMHGGGMRAGERIAVDKDTMLRNIIFQDHSPRSKRANSFAFQLVFAGAIIAVTVIAAMFLF